VAEEDTVVSNLRNAGYAGLKVSSSTFVPLIVAVRIEMIILLF